VQIYGDGFIIELMDEFCYLGDNVWSGWGIGDADVEVTARICTDWFKF